MKGIVFTEFLDLVEDQFGIQIVQEIIDSCDLSTGGAYTSVGTYDHKEMFQMVGKLAEIKSTSVGELLELYGNHFFGVLAKSYPQFMEEHDLFTFLSSIDGYIHPEVLKLYPDAELPRFSSEVNQDGVLILVYESSRKMADFAIGLLKGASDFFKSPIQIEKVKTEKDGQRVVLKLVKIEG